MKRPYSELMEKANCVQYALAEKIYQLGRADAIKMAEEALEKQIPKKPIIARNLMTKHVSVICSNCNTDITFYGSNAKYCHNCGQEIKWD